MPPASLSTLDVIKPGPTTARKTARRRRRLRLRRPRSLPRVLSVESVSFSVALVVVIAATYFKLKLKSQFVAHAAHDVVYRDRANRAILPIYHRQTPQIVLVEQLKYFLIFGVRRHG